MPLIECYETVPGDIFGANNYQLKWPVNSLIFQLPPLSNTIIDTIKCFNFNAQMFLTVNKTKKS